MTAMTAVAGSLKGFEGAVRALFAGGQTRGAALRALWPTDVSHDVQGLAAAPWSSDATP